MKPKLRRVEGMLSWILKSNRVELAVTRMGGHIAPVTFDRQSRRPIRPFWVSPFAKFRGLKAPPLMKALRGDFFCLPFGGSGKRGSAETHPPHGETANGVWKYVERRSHGGIHCLELELLLKVRPGHVTKRIILRDDENAVYQEHVIRGMSGWNCPAHHPMLECPSDGRIAVSRFLIGSTYNRLLETAAEGSYCGLKPGVMFRKLGCVPMIYGGTSDLSIYPSRKGFVDIVQIVADPKTPVAWNTITFERAGWLYFSLRSPRVLRQTAFWFLNGGRRSSPWQGQERVLGIEDCTGYLADGLGPSSRSNPWTRLGIPTRIKFNPKHPLSIRYLMGAVRIPRGFEVVRGIDFRPQRVVFRGKRGKVEAKMDWKFVEDSKRFL